jgi:hypothetical protein
MNARELSLYRKRGASALAAEAERQLAARRSSSRRTAPKKAEGRQKKRDEQQADRRRRARVYAAVDARSGGVCEFVGPVLACMGDAAEHDHFWGRGKAEETPENVWHLCKFHHDNKTANDPSRRVWIERFRGHCYRNAFREELAKCDRALAIEEAQHPTPAAREET